MDSRQAEFNSEEALKQFKKEVELKGYPEVTQINKRIENLIATDKYGNERIINLKPKQSGTESFGPCNQGLLHCTNATDASELEIPEIMLSYSTRVKYCGNAANNSDVEVRWEMSVPYNIVAQNLSGSLSRGRIRFKNSQNQIVASYLTITPITITNIGVDPDCSNRTVFEIKFGLTNLSNALFENGNTMETNFFVYTDCDYDTDFTAGNWEQTITPPASGSAGTPCTRTDVVWISHPQSSPGAYAQALGVGTTIGCYFPYGWVYPNVQYLEYWKNNNPSTVYSHNLDPFGYYNMTQMTYASGAWTIRYRNQMTSSPTCNGPWFYEYRTL